MKSPAPVTTEQTESTETTSIISIFLRVFWMFLGNIALGASALVILKNDETLFSAADLAYGVTIPLLIFARYVEIARYRGATAYGEPATITDWKRYTGWLLGIGLVGWMLCHGIAYVWR